jgi:hypothetical protein
MMKSVRILSMAAAAAALAAPCALALDRAVVKVTVPFDFVVADRHLPSGEYHLVESYNPSVVQIYSKDQEHLVSTFCLRQSWEAGAGGKGKLVFRDRGGQRFLKMLRTEDGSTVYFPKTRTENEAQARGEARATGAAAGAVGTR